MIQLSYINKLGDFSVADIVATAFALLMQSP